MSDTMNTGGSGLAKVAGMLGWLAVIGGLALVGYGAYLMFAADADAGPAIMTLVGGALTAGFGLLAVLNSIMTTAMIDTANATARLLAAGGTSAATAATSAAAVDNAIPGFSASRDDSTSRDDAADPAPYGEKYDVPDLPPFDTAPAAPVPPAPPIVPDASNPELWPLAIDEFDLDGHLAMTLEDGTIAVETSEGWRRLPSLEDARTWLSQGI